MLFVRTDDLKPGMRLAKPIYNKMGVMLYERDSKLTMQGIVAIRNFGFIGIYILEMAEPVPPMTEEDIEFERFQTVGIFGLKEDMDRIKNNKRPNNIVKTTNQIVAKYGGLDHKINFIQNLRSQDDTVYKHSLNVAILCALMSKTCGMQAYDQSDLVVAALFHDLGKLLLPPSKRYLDEDTAEGDDLEFMNRCMREGYEKVRNSFNLSQNVQTLLGEFYSKKEELDELSRGCKILQVADAFDRMTAMKIDAEPSSEITAIRTLQSSGKYDKDIVKALIQSINILMPGVCVELTNGAKGLVITENTDDVLRPLVLGFEQNQLYQLSSDTVYANIQIKDIMKTMDNRFVMDRKLLEEYQG